MVWAKTGLANRRKKSGNVTWIFQDVTSFGIFNISVLLFNVSVLAVWRSWINFALSEFQMVLK